MGCATKHGRHYKTCFLSKNKKRKKEHIDLKNGYIHQNVLLHFILGNGKVKTQDIETIKEGPEGE